MTTTAQFDFTKQAVTAATVKEFEFDLIPGTPSLMCSPAHDSNGDFLDSRLRQAIVDAAKARRGGTDEKPDTVEARKANLAEVRDADREIIARTCVRGWGRAPIATDGTRPEFSPENALAFVRALPDFMFDPFRRWVTNIYNFVEVPPVDEDEARELGN